MTIDRPHFMDNEEWYYFDVKKMRYELTDEAPESAKASYEEFVRQMEN